MMKTSEAKTRGVVMFEKMVAWAGQPDTAWWVLGAAALVILVQAARVSRTALWGDLVEEDE